MTHKVNQDKVSFLLEHIQAGRLSLQDLSECHRENRNLVLAAVKVNGNELSFAHNIFYGDKEVVLAAIDSISRGRGSRYPYKSSIADSLFEDREFVLAYASYNICDLSKLSESFRKDKEVVLAAVTRDKCCHSSLGDTHESLRDDYDVVLAAVSHYGLSIEHASGRLQEDRTIVMTAVSNDPFALEYAHAKYRDDYDVVLAAVSHPEEECDETCFLDIVSERLRGNRDIVLAAVTRNGLELERVYEPLLSDRQVVLRAATQCGIALEFAPKHFLDDTEIVHAALLNMHSPALEHPCTRMRNHRGVVLAAVLLYAGNMHYIADEFKGDKEIMLAALTRYTYTYYFYASKDLQNDFNFVRAAVIRGLGINRLKHQAFHRDRELQRINEHPRDAHAQRLWELVRVYVKRRTIVYFWMETAAKKLGAAHFDEDGEVVIVGRDAKRQKLEFEEMRVAG